MIQTCLAFISRVMTNAYVSVEEVDDYIKLFLSAVHNFERLTYVVDSNRPYIWYSKANFLSLLNLPDQIRELKVFAIIGKEVEKDTYNLSNHL